MELPEMISEMKPFDTENEITIGVLAVQGSFYEHIDAITRLKSDVYAKNENGLKNERLKIKVIDIRSSQDVSPNMRGLIIPGGESTTLNIFLKCDGFFEKIQEWISCEGNVVWGTCAGMILLSNSILSQKDGGQLKFGGVDVTTCRNYYGRQRQSFESSLDLHDEELIMCMPSDKNDNDTTFHGIFIRAPGIVTVDNKKDVKVLATLNTFSSEVKQTSCNGTNDVKDNVEKDIVAVRQDNMMITSFHPELTNDLRFHKYFVDMVIAGLNTKKKQTL